MSKNEKPGVALRTRSPSSDPPFIEALDGESVIETGSYTEVRSSVEAAGYAIIADSVTPRERIWSNTGRDPGELNDR